MIDRLAAARAIVALLGLTMAVLMFGPFQGLEEKLGLSDKMAHATAFYALTLGIFVSFPRNRRTDLALIVMFVAGASEVIQGLVGRSMSFGDFAADSAGIAVAMLPAAIERFRHGIRGEARSRF